ncbi:hypothetical protein N7462_009034 [Penicillium macrosclerotiorum]|uniref:uncharacterized protein n=1 Tax=Penicillium macrosclerotiorum TaxID=303699 RepID=UPI0025475487|nr:uncharacterized protein N7462_009034 [Penicillium macrosclerotiorum]KAJ5676137.1 hypothetical protein N7462_009034 [Penicillium macrosclerotiorum]
MTTPTIPKKGIEDVLQHIIPQIERHIESQASAQTKRPFVLGLTGLQGSGKSTWTDALVKTLRDQHKYNTINVSLDDLYFDHHELVQVRGRNPQNRLLQTRGQPGTHDTALAVSFFKDLLDSSKEILIPAFDKSKFGGEGDRADQDSWPRVPAGTSVDIVVFEGWCVGFQPLGEESIRCRWNEAQDKKAMSGYLTETLRDHAVESLLQVNSNLREYSEMFMGSRHFDFLVHLDTDDLVNVYEWRIQQEHALRKRTNRGMTDEAVVKFVRGYMPAYELYLDQLRRGFFKSQHRDAEQEKGQLRVVLDKERKILKITLA